MKKMIFLLLLLTSFLLVYTQNVVTQLFPVNIGDIKFDALEAIYMNGNWEEDFEMYKYTGSKTRWVTLEGSKDSVQLESRAYKSATPIEGLIQSTDIFVWVNYINHVTYRVYYKASYELNELAKCLEDYENIVEKLKITYPTFYDNGEIVATDDNEKLGEYYEFGTEDLNGTHTSEYYWISIRYSILGNRAGDVFGYDIEIEQGGFVPKE